MINHQDLRAAMRHAVTNHVMPALQQFVEVPNLSRAYDPNWDKNGLMQQACNLCIKYATDLGIKGLELRLHEVPEKTPMVFGIIQATATANAKNLMFYGHIDKQPHLTEGWREGLHPTKPVIENGLLYGRGGVDDGYNFFTVLSMIKTLQEKGIPHDRIVLFFETDEESSSRDIIFWVDHLKEQIGTPDVMFCLDSTGLNNKHVWITTTLRGQILFDVKVKVLEKGVHSGMASGIIPSSFRLLRQLLDRIEDPKTGQMAAIFQPNIPEDKLEQATKVGKLQDDSLWKTFPVVKTARPATEDLCDAYISNIWRPQIEVVGQRSIPDIATAGNVLRDETIVRISMRIPPNAKHLEVFNMVKQTIEADPPCGAEVSCELYRGGTGWCANSIPQNVLDILEAHSQAVFQTPVCFNGCGGSIPFINLLQQKYPETLLIVSGVALPDCNAHGPNENLDIEYLHKFSEVLASFVADYAAVNSK